MLNWKRNVFRKKANFSKGQTSGKSKGGHMHPDSKHKYFMSNPKAVKEREYGTYHRKAYALNKQQEPSA